MPHTACSPADDDLPTSSSGSLDPLDVDSIPTASTPRDAEDAEVGSQEGTHQEEAPEAPQGSLPDFAPDSTPEPEWFRSPAGGPLVRRESLRHR